MRHTAAVVCAAAWLAVTVACSPRGASRPSDAAATSESDAAADARRWLPEVGVFPSTCATRTSLAGRTIARDDACEIRVLLDLRTHDETRLRIEVGAEAFVLHATADTIHLRRGDAALPLVDTRPPRGAAAPAGSGDEHIAVPPAEAAADGSGAGEPGDDTHVERRFDGECAVATLLRISAAAPSPLTASRLEETWRLCPGAPPVWMHTATLGDGTRERSFGRAAR